MCFLDTSVAKLCITLGVSFSITSRLASMIFRSRLSAFCRFSIFLVVIHACISVTRCSSTAMCVLVSSRKYSVLCFSQYSRRALRKCSRFGRPVLDSRSSRAFFIFYRRCVFRVADNAFALFCARSSRPTISHNTTLRPCPLLPRRSPRRDAARSPWPHPPF